MTQRVTNIVLGFHVRLEEHKDYLLVTHVDRTVEEHVTIPEARQERGWRRREGERLLHAQRRERIPSHRRK